MKKLILITISFLLIINTIYIFRGIFVYPYPTGDGLARWMFVGKTLFHQPPPPSTPTNFPYRDDYPLLVPLLVNLSLNLFNNNTVTSMLPFFLPYLLLTIFCLYRHLSPWLIITVLTLPLFEQMSGRGLVGFADHFLAVLIAISLFFNRTHHHTLSVLFALLAAHTKNEGQLFAFLLFIFNMKTSLYILLPLNLLIWHSYLFLNHLTWFYLTTPTSTLTLTLILSRFPTLIFLTLRSFFNPSIFSFAGPTLIFRLLTTKLNHLHLLLFSQLLFYFITFLLTPTSIDFFSHYSVAVDRLLLHILIPLLLL